MPLSAVQAVPEAAVLCFQWQATVAHIAYTALVPDSSPISVKVEDSAADVLISKRIQSPFRNHSSLQHTLSYPMQEKQPSLS